MKDIIKLEFVIIGISTIIIICAYSSIGAYSSQLALVENLVLMAVNWHLVSKVWCVWCQIFRHVTIVRLARRWHRWHVVGTVGTSLARFYFS